MGLDKLHTECQLDMLRPEKLLMHFALKNITSADFM